MIFHLSDYRNDLFLFKNFCQKHNIQILTEKKESDTYNITSIKVLNKYPSEFFFIEKIEYNESNSFFSFSLKKINKKYKQSLKKLPILDKNHHFFLLLKKMHQKDYNKNLKSKILTL